MKGGSIRELFEYIVKERKIYYEKQEIYESSKHIIVDFNVGM